MGNLVQIIQFHIDPAIRRELLAEFRADIAAGRIHACVVDIEKLPIPPYLTLTCDPQYETKKLYHK